MKARTFLLTVFCLGILLVACEVRDTPLSVPTATAIPVSTITPGVEPTGTPFDLLFAVVPTFAFGFRGFDTLAVNDRRTGFCFTLSFLTHGFTQGIIHSFPDPLLAPSVEVAVDRLPGGKVMGQHTPGTAAP